ncbi:hypothetical protein GEV33_004915 [Tenebrio molitor]|uniref:Uncharacterized protein n=1 Tax=Tenebrio molitor TaxID=7067 RepID=A0A8J6HNI3_TENMO|nr:hypothetical protein GEV33_004915 [Tenebrio molitor]
MHEIDRVERSWGGNASRGINLVSQRDGLSMVDSGRNEGEEPHLGGDQSERVPRGFPNAPDALCPPERIRVSCRAFSPQRLTVRIGDILWSRSHIEMLMITADRFRFYKRTGSDACVPFSVCFHVPILIETGREYSYRDDTVRKKQKNLFTRCTLLTMSIVVPTGIIAGRRTNFEIAVQDPARCTREGGTNPANWKTKIFLDGPSSVDFSWRPEALRRACHR